MVIMPNEVVIFCFIESGLVRCLFENGHNAWYLNPYDTHIPMLWYGWGIQKGVTNRTVNMTDIAATLATLLHIQVPNGCIGVTIPEVIK